MTQHTPMDNLSKFTGSCFSYYYEELPRQADQDMIKSFCDDRRRLFAPIAKNFDVVANSRWVLRHYLAIKFVTAANILAGSAVYAHAQNLMLGVPYFNYYAVLNACRAFLLTSPQVIWKGEETLRMPHGKILNITADYMRALDFSRMNYWRLRLASLRDYRELFSYRFPLSGPNAVNDDAFDVDTAIALGRLIAELASLSSECLDAELRKHSSLDIPVMSIDDRDWTFAYSIAGVKIIDPDDLYRFNKLITGWKTVSPLQVMTSDGLMDDVYGTWCDSSDRSNVFDPDATSGLILDL
jgi:hypothetical protein